MEEELGEPEILRNFTGGSLTEEIVFSTSVRTG
jgi:hypothetical protein